MDQQIETVFIPKYTRGKRRKLNPPHRSLSRRREHLRKKGDFSQEKELTAAIRQLPSRDPFDPNFRRLHYIRYADDFLIGLSGPIKEAKQIREELTKFLREHLALELNQEKTLITHAGSRPARFLGYNIQTQYANDRISNGSRSTNGKIGLRIPESTINEYERMYTRHGKPTHISVLLDESDFAIVQWYGNRLRGIVQYYKLAYNVSYLWRLATTMERSMLKTLAAKHRTSTLEMRNTYKTYINNGVNPKARCIEVHQSSADGKRSYVARFGGISIRRDARAKPRDISIQPYWYVRSELLDRLLARECELCGMSGKIEIHHIRALKDLNQNGRKEKPLWVKKMAAMRRKTLAVCRACHQNITHGRYTQDHAN